MSIKQISVFVENKAGALNDLVNVLAAAHVDMRAMAMADTQEFGILRMIVDKHDEACAALRAEGYLVSVNDVLAVEIPDTPGGLCKVVNTLSESGINTEYAYAFMTRAHGHACVVFRVEDNAAAEAILAQNGIDTLKMGDEAPW